VAKQIYVSHYGCVNQDTVRRERELTAALTVSNASLSLGHWQIASWNHYRDVPYLKARTH